MGDLHLEACERARSPRSSAYLKFTDIDCIRLIETRFPQYLDGVCTRDADGDGADDGFWTLRSKDCVDPPI